MNPENVTPNSAGHAVRWLSGKIAYSVGFGVVVLLLIGAGLVYFYGKGGPPLQVVRIGYGAGAPVRARFLEQMALHGKQHNLDIQLVATGGTDQTLSLIDENGADLGLIAGVVEDRASRRVLELMPLYMEPLQLLVKTPLYEPVLNDFGALRGKSIDLDSESSATHLLATELLRFIGLTDPVTGQPQYQPVHISQSELAARTHDRSLPDAIFQIGGVPSETIRKLIANNDYRLVPLPFGESFNLDKFREAEAPEPSTSSRLRLNKGWVEEAIIPAFAYSVLPAVPPSDTRTIATRLVLVGSDRVDALTARRILDLILSPDISSFSTPPLTDDLLNTRFEFARHPGTDAYLASLKPFNVDGAFQTYSRVGELWGVIITVYLVGSRGLKMWKERRAQAPTKSVGDFLSEIIAVEAAVHASCANDERILLDQKLSDIKKDAIELRLAGRLDDAENFPSLLVTLADARSRIWGSVPRGRTLGV